MVSTTPRTASCDKACQAGGETDAQHFSQPDLNLQPSLNARHHQHSSKTRIRYCRSSRVQASRSFSGPARCALTRTSRRKTRQRMLFKRNVLHVRLPRTSSRRIGRTPLTARRRARTRAKASAFRHLERSCSACRKRRLESPSLPLVNMRTRGGHLVPEASVEADSKGKAPCSGQRRGVSTLCQRFRAVAEGVRPHHSRVWTRTGMALGKLTDVAHHPSLDPIARLAPQLEHQAAMTLCLLQSGPCLSCHRPHGYSAWPGAKPAEFKPLTGRTCGEALRRQVMGAWLLGTAFFPSSVLSCMGCRRPPRDR